MQNKGLGNLRDSAVGEMIRGIDVISSLSDADYTRSSVRSGSVGAQFRHNLDIVNSFLKGLAEGRIDYERRERDPLAETDRNYAACRFALAVGALRQLTFGELQASVLVRSEIDPGVFHQSSVTRELEFLLSHTIHHHALIAEKLETYGIFVPRTFGVAPSTLKYWRQERINSVAA